MATIKKTTNQGKTDQSQVMTPEYKAQAALTPSVNAAAVIEAYQGNVMGKDADMNVMVERLRKTFAEVKSGDLHTLEAMLISQAMALQTIFTSLARRAQSSEYQKNFDAFLGLALKAQAQSRATISALVDLKYPRQATFVKQANISHGPQQINNGGTQASAHSHGEKTKSQQNELIEEQRNGRTQLDTRATAKAAQSHPEVETVEAVHRTTKRQR